MADIRTNLLKNRQVLSEKDYQKEQNYLRIAIMGLVAVVIGVISLSLWTFVLTRKLSGIEQAITTVSKDMQGFTQASAEQMYLKTRLKLVMDFLGGRTLTRESLQNVLSIKIPGTHISGLDFQDENTLVVQYASADAAALGQLIEYFQADKNYFSQVLSKGLSKSRDGGYQLSLVLSLPAKGSK